MTNAQIIYVESLELVKQGILKVINGQPEPIHTFAKWKSIGYSVKKGEKAVAKITIWKYTSRTKTDEDGNETEDNRCFPKTSAFVKTSQVERMENND